MAHGKRCDNGCASWPPLDRYKTCPICCERTTDYSNLQPLDEHEALEEEFEAFYKDWDASHPPERLDWADEDSLRIDVALAPRDSPPS